MYLVRTYNGDAVMETVEEIKLLDKATIRKIYSLSEVVMTL